VDDFLYHLDPQGPQSYLWDWTYVCVPIAGSPDIIAYYTLAPDPAVLLEIPAEDEVETETIVLKYLGVGVHYQKQGVGEDILLSLMEQIVAASAIHPTVSALMLYALDDRAMQWYLSRDFGFQQVGSGAPYLILPVATMKDALVVNADEANDTNAPENASGQIDQVHSE